MSRNVPIHFTDEVLTLVDSCVEKTKGNRSSFVRDACLRHVNAIGDEEVTYAKLSQENGNWLKRAASQLNMDHDKLLNRMFEQFREDLGDNPFDKMD